MTPVRLGSVSYLNARPCVVGLERDPRFDLRFDLPARCAALLHERTIDAGLIPSIEYLRAPGGPDAYRIVPDIAIGSRGAVASVALYTGRSVGDVQSIAMDTSSRTSVALTRVLCSRAFHIDPEIHSCPPNLQVMLQTSDAALIIGDAALLLDHASVDVAGTARGAIQKIDLGETWTNLTGLPFVYAFWAGHAGALDTAAVRALQDARDRGVNAPERVAEDYFRQEPALVELGTRYLRDNIQYRLGEAERAGLEMFYRYAAEAGLAPEPGELRFY
jgi:chorismate dehydratase